MRTYESLEQKKNNFIDATWRVVDTPEELEALINDFKSMKTTDHTVFRGICEAKYMLFTSLQRDWAMRHLNKRNIEAKVIVNSLLSFLKGSGHPLSSYYRSLGIEPNDWLLLSVLQHYNAPSPLLDFSKSYLAALYFMCSGCYNSDGHEEIDQYMSIVYFKAMQACNGTALSSIIKTAANICKDHTDELNSYKNRDIFTKDYLSFASLAADDKLLLIPAYKSVTSVRARNNHWYLNLPVSNLNMVCQEGEFICNISKDTPLEEMMKDGASPLLNCVNIHKSLYHYIIDKYLKGSLEVMKSELFPTEYQLAEKAYFKAMANL